MLIAMLAGSVVSVASVACPPENLPSGGDGQGLPQVGQVTRVLRDDPAPGTVDCMGTPAPVRMSEAPFEQQYTDAMLNKVWVTSAAGASLKEFAAAVGKGADREVFVDWERLASVGVKPETTISVPLTHVYIEQAFRLVNERLGAGGTGGKVAARRTGDLIEISTQETFDRRERKTVAFDLRPLLAGLEPEAAQKKVKEITGALVMTVEPDGWADNGGDTARQSMAEGRMFVVAPPRIQKAVAWFFGQVSDRPLAGADALRAAEPVQVLDIAPMQINAAEREAVELRAQLRHLRRELAWKRVMLGEPLTADDQAAMDDARAVHAVGASGPAREQVEKEAHELAARVEFVRARLERVNPQSK